MFIFVKEKIDVLRLLGAQVTTVPVVAFTDPNNYNHHVFILKKYFLEDRMIDLYRLSVMLNNMKILYGQINLIIERIEMDIIKQPDRRSGHKQVEKCCLIVYMILFLDGKVNAVVMSTGTGGTLAGISMYLKEKNSQIRTVLADPPV
jgi:cysteine synthase A